MDYEKLSNQNNVSAIFIAEAGINHDGSFATAKKMVDAAVSAGADYVKFQSFKAEKLVTPNALTSTYIDAGSHKGESFKDLLKRLELNFDQQKELNNYCYDKGVKFLSTAFDVQSFDYAYLLNSAGQLRDNMVVNGDIRINGNYRLNPSSIVNGNRYVSGKLRANSPLWAVQNYWTSAASQSRPTDPTGDSNISWPMGYVPDKTKNKS